MPNVQTANLPLSFQKVISKSISGGSYLDRNVMRRHIFYFSWCFHWCNKCIIKKGSGCFVTLSILCVLWNESFLMLFVFTNNGIVIGCKRFNHRVFRILHSPFDRLSSFQFYHHYHVVAVNYRNTFLVKEMIRFLYRMEHLIDLLECPWVSFVLAVYSSLLLWEKQNQLEYKKRHLKMISKQWDNTRNWFTLNFHKWIWQISIFEIGNI